MQPQPACTWLRCSGSRTYTCGLPDVLLNKDPSRIHPRYFLKRSLIVMGLGSRRSDDRCAFGRLERPTAPIGATSGQSRQSTHSHIRARGYIWFSWPAGRARQVFNMIKGEPTMTRFVMVTTAAVLLSC